MSLSFGIMGVAGYIATRHLHAIKEVGGTVWVAVDPFDSVGRLDSYGLNIRYGRDITLLDDIPLDWLSVCTPNYLHLNHCLEGLERGVNVICEKPLVIRPTDLDLLKRKEQETNRRVYTVLQLRCHPAVLAIKNNLTGYHTVKVDYHSPRGPWYWQSWKGDQRKSGGLLFNIGIHLFDLLLWLFGPVQSYEINHHGPQTATGILYLEQAIVSWSLSIDPKVTQKREVIIDGLRLDLTENFNDLHAEVYRQALNGNGCGIDEARGAIELCYQMR